MWRTLSRTASYPSSLENRRRSSLSSFRGIDTKLREHLKIFSPPVRHFIRLKHHTNVSAVLAEHACFYDVLRHVSYISFLVQIEAAQRIERWQEEIEEASRNLRLQTERRIALSRYLKKIYSTFRVRGREKNARTHFSTHLNVYAVIRNPLISFEALLYAFVVPRLHCPMDPKEDKRLRRDDPACVSSVSQFHLECDERGQRRTGLKTMTRFTHLENRAPCNLNEQLHPWIPLGVRFFS